MKINKINNIDCIEGMRQLVENNEKFDLILTSPPYNIENFHANLVKYDNYRGNDMNEACYQTWQLECLNLMYKLLKNKGSLWYNHKVRIKNGKAIHPLEWIFQSEFILKQEIVWNQQKGANTDKIRCFPFSERIYWLTKDPQVKIFNSENVRDVWDIVPKHKRKEMGHPAVMAIEVSELIYKLHEQEHKNKVIKVLDPFAGVGTSFIPIVTLDNYEFVGLEINKKYCELGNKRIKICKEEHDFANKQTTLFELMN